VVVIQNFNENSQFLIYYACAFDGSPLAFNCMSSNQVNLPFKFFDDSLTMTMTSTELNVVNYEFSFDKDSKYAFSFA